MIRKNFNDDWQIMKGGSGASTASFMGNAAMQKIHLPHDAMIHEQRDPDTENDRVLSWRRVHLSKNDHDSRRMERKNITS